MNRLYLTDKQISDFQKKIWEFYGKNKRDLPWRNTRDPYHIFISEVMLQQTQVERVIPKYEAFIKEFADFQSLAKASLSLVLRLWQGLGYNRRALYLHRSAGIISQHYDNVVPQDPKILDSLPGIGEATVSSIIVFSYNIPLSFIETNIRRVFIDTFFHRDSRNLTLSIPGIMPKKIYDNELLPLINQTLDQTNPRKWYYGLMDYGAMLGKTIDNPNKRSAHYSKQSKFEGSHRELRGKILKYLARKNPITKRKLMKDFNESSDRMEKILIDLKKEGFPILIL